MKIEDFEEITDAIYCAMNSTKLLGICEMLLSHLKETTLHGPRWNNSPVSPLVLFSLFLQRFGICILIASTCHSLVKFSGKKTHGQDLKRQRNIIFIQIQHFVMRRNSKEQSAEQEVKGCQRDRGKKINIFL